MSKNLIDAVAISLSVPVTPVQSAPVRRDAKRASGASDEGAELSIIILPQIVFAPDDAD